eukprot:11684371-Prorocentrum_lima.AAC.1
MEESDERTQRPTSMKARQTARGFKDMQAYTENIKTYSGPATNGHSAQSTHMPLTRCLAWTSLRRS